jgi:hypothetical protein
MLKVLIVDEINNIKVILLGKSNKTKRHETYESFGGKAENDDITTLHTAVRELVEEFFNHKVSTKLINEITKSKELYGIIYLINFSSFYYLKFHFLKNIISIIFLIIKLILLKEQQIILSKTIAMVLMK